MSMMGCVDAAPPAAAEQLCYIPCNFCSIVLAVSVPCSSLYDIVTVRCGHCTNLWSVNMAAAFHQSLSCHDVQMANHGGGGGGAAHPEYRTDTSSSGSSSSNKITTRPHPMSIISSTSNSSSSSSSITTQERIVNRPPEKRQRVPSAYNQFIKEEIQRIKANNPEISHREAFSTAAKNWAHFPHIHFGLMLETNNKAKLARSLRNK